jgi:hypothetical protein
VERKFIRTALLQTTKKTRHFGRSLIVRINTPVFHDEQKLPKTPNK